MDVRIKRIDKDLPLPEYLTSGSCGFDMYSREARTIEAGEIALLPSNLIIETPVDYVLIIAPRSSLARKKGLTMPNSMGIIDRDYAGEDDEILIQVENITQLAVTVDRGERIAQGIFLKMAAAQWQETDQMQAASRGGLGSTGGYKESP
jgi:dUTP pyrophosphatase